MQSRNLSAEELRNLLFWVTTPAPATQAGSTQPTEQLSQISDQIKDRRKEFCKKLSILGDFQKLLAHYKSKIFESFSHGWVSPEVHTGLMKLT